MIPIPCKRGEKTVDRKKKRKKSEKCPPKEKSDSPKTAKKSRS